MRYAYVRVFSECSLCITTKKYTTQHADHSSTVWPRIEDFSSCSRLTARWHHYFLPSHKQDGNEPFNPAAAAVCMRLAGCTSYVSLGLFD